MIRFIGYISVFYHKLHSHWIEYLFLCVDSQLFEQPLECFIWTDSSQTQVQVNKHKRISLFVDIQFGLILSEICSHYSFIMFALLLILFTISWVFSLTSRIEYGGIFYLNLTISAIQAPLVLYICVLRQKHVTYLLQKACCSKQPLSGADWGDEMTYINTANH